MRQTKVRYLRGRRRHVTKTDQGGPCSYLFEARRRYRCVIVTRISICNVHALEHLTVRSEAHRSRPWRDVARLDRQGRSSIDSIDGILPKLNERRRVFGEEMAEDSVFVFVLFSPELGRQHVTAQLAEQHSAPAECPVERDQLAPHELPLAG